MKRILILALGVLMFAGTCNAANLKTGFQSETTTLSDTLFFYNGLQTAQRFEAKHLWIGLDADASGSVTIQRGVRINDDSIAFFDDAQTIIPGGDASSGDEIIFCFMYTKTAASDKLYYSAGQAELGSINNTIAEILALLKEPTPVTVSESNIFTGLTLNSRSAGSATNLKAAASRTFPVSAGIDVHGAKALYLVIDWTDFKHGGFTVQHKFSPSATDTSFYYYDGALWASADTVGLSDSTGSLAGTPRGVAGSAMLRIPDVPGAGYYFCKITAYGVAARDTIGPINGTLVKVE
jgi:hypothetical protein